MSTAPVMRLLGVAKRFGARPVLRGLEAEVELGKIVALVGNPSLKPGVGAE